MDVVSPISLLEVTMGEENHADDDCIIIDDDDDETHSATQGNVTKMEVEVDPLFVAPSVVYNDKQNDMPTLWVTTNITNLAGVTQAEVAFRKSQYSNTYEVLMEILHCTICRDHVGCDVRIHPSSIEHPVLRVLICQQCVCMYKTVNFIMNDKGKEMNCRWCGKTSAKDLVIRTCQQCPFSFCEVCLKNNCPDYFQREPHFPWWTCIVCSMTVLWPARATLWALHCLKTLLLTNPGNALAKINGDISLCCKYRKQKKKVVIDALQTLGTEETFDWNQIVPPHLLNGDTEVDLYRRNLPEIDFSNSIKSYPNPPKQVKSRAKPRPRSKTKPKPKSKTIAASTLSSPSVSIPTVVSPQLNNKISITNPSIDKKPHWLKQKLIGYINDFDQLKNKLEDIGKSLDFDENDPQTEEKVDSVTTLLSLHRELLNSCRLSLINEWKERKARLLLEKYNANTEEVAEIKNETPSPNAQEKVAKTKMSNNRKKSNCKANLSSNKKYGNVDNKTCHQIKDCFVKLKRLEMPMDFLIRQERKYF